MIEFEKYLDALRVKPKRRVIGELFGMPIAIDYDAKPGEVHFVDAADKVLGRIVNIGGAEA